MSLLPADLTAEEIEAQLRTLDPHEVFALLLAHDPDLGERRRVLGRFGRAVEELRRRGWLIEVVRRGVAEGEVLALSVLRSPEPPDAPEADKSSPEPAEGGSAPGTSTSGNEGER